MSVRFALVVALSVLAVVQPARAHHSFAAEFDAGKLLKATGTVARIEWSNPHVLIWVDLPDDAGAFATWRLELGSPSVLASAGWTRYSLKAGDRVTVEGPRARDGSHRARAAVIVLADSGRRLAALPDPAEK
jgi:hypothetical protein